MAGKHTELTTKQRARQNATVAGAKAGREHAEDDLARGQTPIGRDKADKLLGIQE